MYEILIINDGSTDNTLELLDAQRMKDLRFNYLSLSRNFGKENALLAGFDYVTGDCCIIMDADLQHPVDVIPQMIQCWEDGFEDVYGSRISRGKESWFRKKFSLTYYKLLQSSTRFDIMPNVGDFRLLDKRCIQVLREMRETQRYTKGLYAWIGFKKKGVQFTQADSVRKNSSFNFRSLLNLAIEGITCFTTSPLRIASVLGLFVALISIVALLWIVIKTIIWGDSVQGFPTLICVILALGGLQLLSIGIIGEYIGRIFNETKNRPVYIADIYNGEKVSINI